MNKQQELPIHRWYRLLKEKGLSYSIDAWLSIITNVVRAKETTMVNDPVTGNKVKRAVILSSGAVCNYLGLDDFETGDCIDAEKVTVKVVDAVYSVLNDNGIETGYKVGGEVIDKVIELLDFNDLPKLSL